MHRLSVLGIPLTREQQALAAATSAVALGLVLAQSGAPKRMLQFLSRLRFPWLGRSQRHAISVGPVLISDESRLRHTHVVGATGSGKTVLLEQMIYQDLLRGHGALIIDPKGDRELYERVKSFCRKIGRESDLHLLSATYCGESVRWNPCRLGGAAELQTKWFQSGVYGEPFYAKACELGLLQAFNCLTQSMPEGFSLTDLVNHLEEISRRDKDENLKGLSYELLNIAQGEWGEMLCSKSVIETRREVSLIDVTRKNEILFVDLPTEAKAVQSSRVGKLLLQEMMVISGMRKIFPGIRGEKPFSVYVDEFDAFATEGFATFLNKGRSSGFMIHMAHQTLSDLKKVSETFAGQVLGNCAVRFIFRQDNPEDAETWAKFMGTVTEVSRTFQTQDGLATGMSSNRESQAFRIHPDTIKDLKTGECIFSDKRTGQLKQIQLPFPIRPPVPKYFPKLRAESAGRVLATETFRHAPDRFDRLASAFQPTETKKGDS